MAITVYYSPMSSAVRVVWTLEELGIPFEKVKLDLRAGDQKKPEFLKINPNGKVPALVDGDAKIFENLGIMLHLGERYGVEKGLWPAAGTRERAEAYAWSSWALAEVLVPARELAVHDAESRFPSALPKEQRATQVAEQARATWNQNMGILEAHLAGRPYVLSDAFTFADLAIAANVGFGHLMVGLPLDKNTAAWFARCTAERPAFGRAMTV